MNEKIKLALKFAVCSALLMIAYLPTIVWMANRWFAAESYYSHGFFIPLVSIFIIWQRRDALKNITISGSSAGLWIVAASLFVHIICAALKIYFVSGFSLVFAIYGMVLFLFGKNMVKQIIFPLFFLFLMIPLPLVVIGNLTVKLKLMAASLSTFVLNRIGFPCVLDGSVIVMPTSRLEVADPCSGLRSIISLLTLGLIFSYAVKTSYLKKSIIFLSSLPIAIMSNIVRIVVVTAVNDLYGEKIAMGVFHDFMGLFVFAFAFLGLFGVSKIMEPK
jgi:exosortase